MNNKNKKKVDDAPLTAYFGPDTLGELRNIFCLLNTITPPIPEGCCLLAGKGDMGTPCDPPSRVLVKCNGLVNSNSIVAKSGRVPFGRDKLVALFDYITCEKGSLRVVLLGVGAAPDGVDVFELNLSKNVAGMKRIAEWAVGVYRQVLSDTMAPSAEEVDRKCFDIIKRHRESLASASPGVVRKFNDAAPTITPAELLASISVTGKQKEAFGTKLGEVLRFYKRGDVEKFFSSMGDRETMAKLGLSEHGKIINNNVSSFRLIQTGVGNEVETWCHSAVLVNMIPFFGEWPGEDVERIRKVTSVDEGKCINICNQKGESAILCPAEVVLGCAARGCCDPDPTVKVFTGIAERMKKLNALTRHHLACFSLLWTYRGCDCLSAVEYSGPDKVGDAMQGPASGREEDAFELDYRDLMSHARSLVSIEIGKAERRIDDGLGEVIEELKKSIDNILVGFYKTLQDKDGGDMIESDGRDHV